MKLDPAKIWYAESLHPLAILLLPFSILFTGITALRRFLYRKKILKSIHFDIPVIIVGNITVGGTGKTPFVIWLANYLRDKGFQPGIVSRGVGGKKHLQPHLVKANDAASMVGDEALLLMENTQCPVMLCIDRVAAVRALSSKFKCNIILSDDGLQHYRLGRNYEIAIVDAERRFGNQHLLPAGPLRESLARLKKVDLLVVNGGGKEDEYTMDLQPLEFVSLINPEHKIPFQKFMRTSKIHAVAGIGHPQRFFKLLKKEGFNVLEHAFPDHHLYKPEDFRFSDTLAIIMTEKDAVKCKAFADERYWFLAVRAKINPALENMLDHASISK